MSIEVVSWNSNKLLTDVDGVAIDRQGVETLKRNVGGLASADAVHVSELFVTSDLSGRYLEDELRSVVGVVAEEEGYTAHVAAYEDTDRTRPNAPENYDHYMVLFGRDGQHCPRTIRLASRNAIAAIIEDQETKDFIDLFAVHFDDRSEPRRQSMARKLLGNTDPTRPTVIAGDLNSMPVDSQVAKLARGRAATLLAEYAPSARARDILERLSSMATGETLQILQDAGFEQTAQSGRSTTHYRGIPFGQLDHVLSANTTVLSTQRHRLCGSDHAAVSARIQTLHP